MPQVLRIASELNHRYGMYSEFSPLHGILATEKNHPTAYNDAGIKDFWSKTPQCERCEWFFGFASVNQLFSWVNCDDAWECISELDQLVYVYDVEERHLLRGNSQCLFMLHEYAPTKSYRIDVFRGLFEPLEKVA